MGVVLPRGGGILLKTHDSLCYYMFAIFKKPLVQTAVLLGIATLYINQSLAQQLKSKTMQALTYSMPHGPVHGNTMSGEGLAGEEGVDYYRCPNPIGSALWNQLLTKCTRIPLSDR